MADSKKYAVVDMETTGTDVNHGDQVIQFSCTFVQDHKIVDEYSTYINNGEHIPRDITKLTGISEETIKDAPSFDQVAPEIYKMLQNTVFVAHNVNFDFPFLNAELEKAGYPELNIEAIDTVTLTQIFFPEIESYHLRNLSKHFGIMHSHPHSSKSDAEATAHLLLKISEKIQSLPLVTIQAILNIHPALPKDTFQFIQDKFDEIKANPSNLDSKFSIVSGLALKNPVIVQNDADHQLKSFPKSKKQKEKMFGGSLSYRESQAKMMNLIYRNFSNEQNPAYNLLIEAPTGSGKTLGYLVPLTYLLKDGGHLILSTSTIGLQVQLQETIKNQVNPLLKTDISTEILKGARHYLDLFRFKQSLSVTDKSKQTQFLKAQILIWLTETTTGDLDELQIPSDAPYLGQISFKSRTETHKNNPFSEFDFLKRQKAACIASDVIIVNHNYLLNNSKTLTSTINEKPYLVVDEAHQLANVSFENSKNSFRLGNLKRSLGRTKNDLFQTHKVNISQIFGNDVDMNNEIETLNKNLDVLFNINRELLEQFSDKFLRHLSNKLSETTISKVKLSELLAMNMSSIETIKRINDYLVSFLADFSKKVETDKKRWTISDNEKFIDFDKHLKEVIKQNDDFIESIKIIENQDDFFWMYYQEDRDPNNVIISSGSFDDTNHLQKNVYNYYKPIVFTGSTLFTSKKSQFIFDELGLKRENTRMQRMTSSFDYANQTLLNVSGNTPEPQNESNVEYVNYLANSIWKLINANTVPTLVLFNSLTLIERVYDKLQSSNNGKFSILASGISGNNEKIARRFRNEKNPVILGANAFWEGIDFSNNFLKQIIVTRIPFDSPDNPITASRIKQWKKENKNPFFGFELPQAILKTKQGIGRLIRSPKDFGTINVLDNRLISKGYGNQIIDSLPKGLPIKSGSISDMVKANQEFFKDHK